MDEALNCDACGFYEFFSSQNCPDCGDALRSGRVREIARLTAQNAALVEAIQGLISAVTPEEKNSW